MCVVRFMPTTPWCGLESVPEFGSRRSRKWVVAQSWEVREVVAVQKEPQANLVHPIRFGERQALAHETRKPLPQSVVPSLDMRRLSAFLACLRMLLGGDDLPIRLPEVAVAMPALISLRHPLPQLAATLFAPVADVVGDHLACLAAQRQPDPAFLRLFEDERPQLVQFQGSGLPIFGVRLGKRFAQLGERPGLFSSQLVTVLRETPKVRESPRRLDLSW